MDDTARRMRGMILAGIAVWMSCGLSSYGQHTNAPPPPRRAAPPAWSPEVRGAFFDDARTALVGQRPNYAIGSADTAAQQAGVSGSKNQTNQAGGYAWSQLISAATIEDEIKQICQRAESDVTTLTDFKADAFKKCRANFSTAAVMFGIVDRFDGPVRWKDQAGILRDRFARAGRNCKVGTDDTYREAQQCRADLADLVRGERIAGAGGENAAGAATVAGETRDTGEATATAGVRAAGGPDMTWDQVADRTPLMQRMEEATQRRIAPWLADQRTFGGKQAEIIHEAEIVAAIAEIVTQDGYEYADDDEFVAYGRRLRDAAKQLGEAAKQDDYEAARRAAGTMNKTCSACHGDYRS